MNNLTSFQVSCLNDLKSLSSIYKFEYNPEFIKAKTKGEDYLIITPVHNATNYEIYIYTDEAGLLIHRDWYMFELPDFNNDSDLLKRRFIEFFRLILTGLDTNKARDITNKTIL